RYAAPRPRPWHTGRRTPCGLTVLICYLPSPCGTPPPRRPGRPAPRDRRRCASKRRPARATRTPVASRLLPLASPALRGGRRGMVGRNGGGRELAGAGRRRARVGASQHRELGRHARILRPPVPARLPHLLRPETVAGGAAPHADHRGR